jgi:hypothetical protein
MNQAAAVASVLGSVRRPDEEAHNRSPRDNLGRDGDREHQGKAKLAERENFGIAEPPKERFLFLILALAADYEIGSEHAASRHCRDCSSKRSG